MAGAMSDHVIEALIERVDLPEGVLLARQLGDAERGVEALLLREGETLKAWHNACPHAGRRLDYAPGRFLMAGGKLVCAAHGAQFELADGRCVDGPGRGGGLTPIEVSPSPEGWRVRWTSP